MGLHALGAARRSLRATIVTSVIVVAATIVGALTGGTLGTMRCVAAASWIGTIVFWWQFRLGLHDSGIATDRPGRSLTKLAGRPLGFCARKMGPQGILRMRHPHGQTINLPEGVAAVSTGPRPNVAPDRDLGTSLG
jgi:hypothetical protein